MAANWLPCIIAADHCVVQQQEVRLGARHSAGPRQRLAYGDIRNDLGRDEDQQLSAPTGAGSALE